MELSSSLVQTWQRFDGKKSEDSSTVGLERLVLQLLAERDNRGLESPNFRPATTTTTTMVMMMMVTKIMTMSRTSFQKNDDSENKNGNINCPIRRTAVTKAGQIICYIQEKALR